ncbi:MAG: hypothetical protein ABIH11_00740 [Candidatus Altiarchaeota archaeon]
MMRKIVLQTLQREFRKEAYPRLLDAFTALVITILVLLLSDLMASTHFFLVSLVTFTVIVFLSRKTYNALNALYRLKKQSDRMMKPSYTSQDI